MLWRDAYNQLRYSHHAAFFQFFRIHLDCQTTFANKRPGTEQKLWFFGLYSPGRPTGHQFSIGWFLSFTIIHSRGKNHHPRGNFLPTIFVVHVGVPTATVSPENRILPPFAEENFWPTLRHGCLPTSYMGIVSKDPHASQYFMELSRFERTLLFNRINVTFRWRKLRNRWMMVIFQKKLEEIVGFEGRKSQQEIQQMPGAWVLSCPASCQWGWHMLAAATRWQKEESPKKVCNEKSFFWGGLVVFKHDPQRD